MSTSNRWISREFADLVATLGQPGAKTPHFDVLIIGSGYGGAMAAAQLAGNLGKDGKALKVAVLERGREYLPGSFPSRMAELPTHVRGNFGGYARKGEGLFDLRLGGDMNVVLANGLGGGSLINAGVMAVPEPEVFKAGWPESWRDATARDAAYVEALALLDAQPGFGAAKPAPAKNLVLQSLAPPQGGPMEVKHSAANITVAISAATSSGGVALQACKNCGDCATGCNYGAKASLDTNLLVRAHRQGAKIYCGATVLKLTKVEDGWQAETVHTDPHLRAREQPLPIHARQVILAAGTLGSTEILLRSQTAGVTEFAHVGAGFSGNGDNLLFGYAYRDVANAFADEDQLPAERKVGPTINGILHTRQAGQHIAFEELASPGPLKQLAEELITTAQVIDRLGSIDFSSHADGHPTDDAFAVQPKAMRHTAIFAAMGDDGAAGKLELLADDKPGVRVRWPEVRNLDLHQEQQRRLQVLARHQGGRNLVNPFWRLLPETLQQVFELQHGPATTVHPLGGCRMADSHTLGTVNALGQVFDASNTDPKAVHAGLLVLDGAAIPTALGINPALTIAAFALRAARALRLREGWQAATDLPPREPLARPVLADTEAEIRARQSLPKAAARFTEKLSGHCPLPSGKTGWGELELHYAPVTLRTLFAPDADGRIDKAVLRLDPAKACELRIYDSRAADRKLVYRASITGSLRLMEQQPTRPLGRVLNAGWAWLRNRGLRDTYQQITAKDQPRAELRIIAGRALGALRLASHAGEVRRFDYVLKIAEVHTTAEGFPLIGTDILGDKRVTYARPSNPWTQLQEVTLREGLAVGKVWKLDQGDLAQRRVPLLTLTEQRDHLEALADTASFLLYFLRMLLSIHIWQGRLPDRAAPVTSQKLPGPLPGIPWREPIRLKLEDFKGVETEARLTRYCLEPGKAEHPPIVCIHGYSASGTTFAHPALKPSLAQALAGQGRDVWVLDLRSSCGHPATAALPWTFERLAFTDIPAAIARVRKETGAAQVDVIAHCMGAAMLSMALLSAGRAIGEMLTDRDADLEDTYQDARNSLPSTIRSIVLSQVGPIVRFTPENTLRAFFVSFVQQWFNQSKYVFEPKPDALSEGLLDRLLGTLPYPPEELLAENPARPCAHRPYVRLRHRMDALYGRTFRLAGMSEQALGRLGDFFGPMNLETGSQVLHFASFGVITNRSGRNVFCTQETLRKTWGAIPTLSIHGEQNGLVDICTADRLASYMKAAGVPHRAERYDKFGHQDCLIGRDTKKIFSDISAFLRQPTIEPKRDLLPPAYIAKAPWFGPMMPLMLRKNAPHSYALSMGTSPHLGTPTFLLVLPVCQNAEQRWVVDRALMAELQRKHLYIPHDSVFSAEGGPTHTDWFSRSLPEWAQHPDIKGLVALYVYPQTDEIADLPMGGGDVWLDPLLHGQNSAEHSDKTKAAIVAAERYLENELPQGVEGRQRREVIIIQPPRTVPQRPAGLCLALGSCQYPPGILDPELAYEAWERLNQHLAKPAPGQKPDLLLLTGDQVYVDQSAGLFDPTQPDDRYRKPYETWLQSRSVRKVLAQLPLAALPDDHEIDDNWEPSSDPDDANHRNDGVAAFHSFMRSRGDLDRSALWQYFDENGIPVFMVDSRSERSKRSASRPRPFYLVKKAQHTALANWLRWHARNSGPKVVMFPSLLLPRHRCAVSGPLAFSGNDEGDLACLRSDSIDGYPEFLAELLRLIAGQQIKNLVFLSGDEHVGMVASIRLELTGKAAVTVHSIHTGGLYAPYAFANAAPKDFNLGIDEFMLGTDLKVRVETTLHPGHGFTLLDFDQKGSGDLWQLHCLFQHQTESKQTVNLGG